MRRYKLLSQKGSAVRMRKLRERQKMADQELPEARDKITWYCGCGARIETKKRVGAAWARHRSVCLFTANAFPVVIASSAESATSLLAEAPLDGLVLFMSLGAGGLSHHQAFKEGA